MRGIKGRVSIVQRGRNVRIENRHLLLGSDITRGCFDLICKGRGGVIVRKAFPSLRMNGEWHPLVDLPVRIFRHNEIVDNVGEGLECEFAYPTSPLLPDVRLRARIYEECSSAFFQVKVRNRGPEPIRIGKVRVLQMEQSLGGSLALGSNLQQAKVYLDSNNLCWTGVKNLFSDSQAQQHESGGMSLLWNAEAGVSFISGFVSADLALTKIVMDASLPLGITSWHGSCAYDELELESGKELCTEELCLSFGQDPFESLKAYGDLLARRYDISPKTATPLLWCSWYSHFGTVDEKAVLENARVIADRFAPYGVDTVQVDYGWNWRHTPGEWRSHEEKFPHGMKWLSERLQEMGLKLGLWVAPFYVGEQSSLFRERPEVLLRDPSNGTPVQYKWKWNTQPKDTWQSVYLMDTTHPRSQKWLEELFREMASWGVSYFKMDFLNGGSRAPLSFSSSPENSFRVRDGEQMRKGLSVIREAVGENTYLLGVNYPITHGIGIVSAVFSAMDVGLATGNYPALKSRMTTLIARYYQQKRLWHNDPDVINLSGRYLAGEAVCSEGEARIRLTAVGLSGGPVLLGDDLPSLAEERLQMYTVCLPAYGQSARPVDLFKNDHPRIWDLDVAADWGAWHVVGLFNFDATDAVIPLSFKDLGLDRNRQYLLWEFWAQEFIGMRTGQVEVKVEKQSARLLLIKEMESHPFVISTSFHVCQGALELSGVKWNDKAGTLAGTANRARGARGSIFFFAPASKLKVAGIRVEGARATSRILSDSTFAVDLAFDRSRADWMVELRRSEG